MNFYISTSKKRYQTFILIILISYFVINSFINLCLQHYIEHKTSKSFFMEDKRSKARHLFLNNKEPKDYIFIGNSRTLFHISTNLFKEHHVNVYNLGISATGITDHVYMINKIFELNPKPKNIVISISINDLFNDKHVGPYLDNTIDDFWYALRTKDIEVIYNTYIGMIKSYALSQRSQELLNKDLYSLYTQNKSTLSLLNTKDKKLLNIFSTNLDCKPFKKVNDKNEVVLCINGDGIIMRDYMPQPFSNKTIYLKKYNTNYVKYLKWLLNDIHNNNIRPIIILEPIQHANFHYDLEHIESELNKSTVIDLTNFNLPDTLWADSMHLNIAGRKVYTQKLIQELTLLKKQPLLTY